MSQQVMLDLSNASARSMGQASRRHGPALSEGERKARRKLARRNRCQVKKESCVDSKASCAPMVVNAAETLVPQYYAPPSETKNDPDEKHWDSPKATVYPARPTFSVMTTNSQPTDLRPYGQARRRLLDKNRRQIDNSTASSACHLEEKVIVDHAKNQAPAQTAITKIDMANAVEPAITSAFNALDPKRGYFVSTPHQPRVTIKDWVALFKGNTEAVRAEKNTSIEALLWTYDPMKVQRSFELGSCFICGQTVDDVAFSIGKQVQPDMMALLSHLALTHGVSAFQLVAMLLVGSSVSPASDTQTCWVCENQPLYSHRFYEHYFDCLLQQMYCHSAGPPPYVDEVGSTGFRTIMLCYLRSCMEHSVYIGDTWRMAHPVYDALKCFKNSRAVQSQGRLLGAAQLPSEDVCQKAALPRQKAPRQPLSILPFSGRKSVGEPPAVGVAGEHEAWEQSDNLSLLLSSRPAGRSSCNNFVDIDVDQISQIYPSLSTFL